MTKSLFAELPDNLPRPSDYSPRRPEHFPVDRIVLAKDSVATVERRNFVDRIIALYPQAKVEERFDTPHNRVEPTASNPLERHRAGKRTLIFGVHKSAVRQSKEENNTCPNYWHFSPYSFCPYDCSYCYLAGTRSVYLSPAVKIFVNLPEMLSDIDQEARKAAAPTAFYLGKLQDALALDPLTGYSRALVPFFAKHPFARMTLLTKCADVDNLLDLEHDGHTILSWSLNPPEIHDQFERNVPHPLKRIEAMQHCTKAGYPVRAVLMPMIPVDGWQEIYGRFIEKLLTAVPLQRLTMAGICSYNDAKNLMDDKLGSGNAVSVNIEQESARRADHRHRFAPEKRIEMYRAMIGIIRKIQPKLDIALCLEEENIMAAASLAESRERCNCVL